MADESARIQALRKAYADNRPTRGISQYDEMFQYLLDYIDQLHVLVIEQDERIKALEEKSNTPPYKSMLY